MGARNWISIVWFLSVCFFVSGLLAQQPKASFVSGNASRLAVENRGTFPPQGGFYYHAFPNGPNALSYLESATFLIAGEVIDVNGDTVHIVNNGFEVDSQSGDPIGWFPRSGYDNPNSGGLAISDDSTSWPSHWQQWPGRYDDGVRFADLEALWVMSDSANNQFEYYPFPDDSASRGLGLEVRCFSYQWAHQRVSGVNVFSFDITNVSPKPLNKLATGIYLTPHIGGRSDYADDSAAFDTTRQMLYFWDPDGVGDFGRPAGTMGIIFLDTPDGNGVTSKFVRPYDSGFVPDNDSLMWQTFFPGILYVDFFSGAKQGIMGSGYFSLAPGETKSLSLALIFGLPSWNHPFPNVDSVRALNNRINTAIDPGQHVFANFELKDNYPNPFNPETTIGFQFQEVGRGRVVVYNILGQAIKSLTDQFYPAGHWQVKWDGTDQLGREVSSGVYFYQLVFEKDGLSPQRAVKKMLLVR